MTKSIAQILAEISSLYPDNTVGDITPAIHRQVMQDITNYAGATPAVFNVMTFGAVGNGVTDDSAAIDTCIAAVSAAGGGTIFFPPGNYLMATDTLIPPSNSIIQGSGIDVTTITNTATAGGKDAVLTVLMTMSGGSNAGTWPSLNTTYAINSPTLGANTVTTTTAGDAGNFHAGDIIMISGSLSGGNTSGSPTDFWFPAWYTKVVSAVAGTGVITLAETLPLGGNNFTLVQKILSLPKNITVRDMTLTVNSQPSAGVSGAIMEVLGVDTFLIENVDFRNANPTFSGAGIALGAPARRSGFRNCHAYQGAGPIELFGASSSFIEGCTTDESAFLVDGGCFDCTVINNVCKDPQENAASFHGIHIPAWTSRIRVIGNSVLGIPSGWAGVNTVDTPDANRFHLVLGNHLTGANATNTAGVNMSKGACVGNVFMNLQTAIQMEGASTGSDPILEGNYFDGASVTTQIAPFSQPTLVRTRQQPVQLQTMPTGTATPTVQGSSSYTLGQSGAQNVTGFQGGLPGDEIVVIVTDNHTTFKNGSNLVMKGAADYNPAANTVMCFVCFATGTPNQYYEKSRSQ